MCFFLVRRFLSVARVRNANSREDSIRRSRPSSARLLAGVVPSVGLPSPCSECRVTAIVQDCYRAAVRTDAPFVVPSGSRPRRSMPLGVHEVTHSSRPEDDVIDMRDRLGAKVAPHPQRHRGDAQHQRRGGDEADEAVLHGGRHLTARLSPPARRRTPGSAGAWRAGRSRMWGSNSKPDAGVRDCGDGDELPTSRAALRPATQPSRTARTRSPQRGRGIRALASS
jgi:hypothetical protein